MATHICTLTLCLIALLAMRRAMMSRTTNWWRYGIMAGIASNFALVCEVFAADLPVFAAPALASLGLLLWWLLREHCAQRRAAHSEGFWNPY